MARLALSRDLLKRYSSLDKRIRNRVVELASIFADRTPRQLQDQSGVHLERHRNQRDPRARTVRIDKNHRGILCALKDGMFVLHDILTHDKADAWMLQKQFTVNVHTGSLEVVDSQAITAEAAALAERSGALSDGSSLFAHRQDKDFTRLGIAAGLVPTLRALTNEDQLSGLLGVLPQGQGEILIDLIGTESVDRIYRHNAGDFVSCSISEDNLEAALESPASRSQFHIVDSHDELLQMLEKPLDQWRVFLHQSQRSVAYKTVFNGPARVTGGAGTGKTVVALHRAKFLASKLSHDDRIGKPILFTTFTKNLAEAIEHDLRELGGTDLLEAVEVSTVDGLAYRLVTESEGKPAICRDYKCLETWKTVVDELAINRSPEFLFNEWEQVVLAQRCRSRSDYLRVSRAGRGIPLDRRGRSEVWDAVESFNQKLSEKKMRTFTQVAEAAAGHLSRRRVRPYKHVIVDEAQDLHQTAWRMLRAAVAEGPNDMFIVGDSHQRIYDRYFSLSRVGINIRGRSRKLRLNYRTTAEIMRWSLQLLGGRRFNDLDGGIESYDYAGYRSFAHGPEPTVFVDSSRAAEVEALVSQVKQWLQDGVRDTDIGVAARAGRLLEPVEAELKKQGVAVCRLGGEMPKRPGVRTATMHRMKGMEFRCVAVTGVSEGELPSPSALTDFSADPVRHKLDLKRETCLLYVACSRAREQLWVGASQPPSRFLPPHPSTPTTPNVLTPSLF